MDPLSLNLAEYTGRYFSAELSTEYEVCIEDGVLFASKSTSEQNWQQDKKVSLEMDKERFTILKGTKRIRQQSFIWYQKVQ